MCRLPPPRAPDRAPAAPAEPRPGLRATNAAADKRSEATYQAAPSALQELLHGAGRWHPAPHCSSPPAPRSRSGPALPSTPCAAPRPAAPRRGRWRQAVPQAPGREMGDASGSAACRRCAVLKHFARFSSSLSKRPTSVLCRCKREKSLSRLCYGGLSAQQVRAGGCPSGSCLGSPCRCGERTSASGAPGLGACRHSPRVSDRAHSGPVAAAPRRAEVRDGLREVTRCAGDGAKCRARLPKASRQRCAAAWRLYQLWVTDLICTGLWFPSSCASLWSWRGLILNTLSSTRFGVVFYHVLFYGSLKTFLWELRAPASLLTHFSDECDSLPFDQLILSSHFTDPVPRLPYHGQSVLLHHILQLWRTGKKTLICTLSTGTQRVNLHWELSGPKHCVNDMEQYMVNDSSAGKRIILLHLQEHLFHWNTLLNDPIQIWAFPLFCWKVVLLADHNFCTAYNLRQKLEDCSTGIPACFEVQNWHQLKSFCQIKNLYDLVKWSKVMFSLSKLCKAH